MQAAVPVRLRRGDVVLHDAHGDVVLRGEQIEQPVDVGHEAAGDPHTRDVGDVLTDGAKSGSIPRRAIFSTMLSGDFTRLFTCSIGL